MNCPKCGSKLIRKILCTSIIDNWGKYGFVGCSSRSDDGYCMRIDDPHCRYQKKVKIIKKVS